MFGDKATNGFDEILPSPLSSFNHAKKNESMTFHPVDKNSATIDEASKSEEVAMTKISLLDDGDEKTPTEEITESKIDENLDHDLCPVEDRMIKETVVTVDTTDKRGHRVGSRAQHTYAAKKTVAQGMMDVALITANANQLRYLVEFQQHSATFVVNVFLIVVSLLLQIAVGVSLIFKGRYDMQGKGKSPQAQIINNYVVVAVFLITIINVFVASFSVTTVPATLSSLSAQEAPTLTGSQ